MGPGCDMGGCALPIEEVGEAGRCQACCPAAPALARRRRPARPRQSRRGQTTTQNTCSLQLIGWDKELTPKHPHIMAPPSNMDDLSRSDSDSDALFDTPAARKNKQRAQDAGDEGAAAGKARTKESHYSTEEAREAALRRELESVRNVNKVIEGVVESLQKAKDNMGVCTAAAMKDTPSMLTVVDRLQDRSERFHPAPDLDAHPLPDRAQPATHPQPSMAGRDAGHARH